VHYGCARAQPERFVLLTWHSPAFLYLYMWLDHWFLQQPPIPFKIHLLSMFISLFVGA
jgi:hypothetical protein